MISTLSEFVSGALYGSGTMLDLGLLEIRRGGEFVFSGQVKKTKFPVSSYYYIYE